MLGKQHAAQPVAHATHDLPWPIAGIDELYVVHVSGTRNLHTKVQRVGGSLRRRYAWQHARQKVASRPGHALWRELTRSVGASLRILQRSADRKHVITRHLLLRPQHPAAGCKETDTDTACDGPPRGRHLPSRTHCLKRRRRPCHPRTTGRFPPGRSGADRVRREVVLADTDTLARLGGALFLGITQGLTEFLPVSSSGHLVLFQQFVDVGNEEVLFDLVLHVGTLIPVLWFYRDWVGKLITDPIAGDGPFLERTGVRWLGYLIAASIPTAIIGLTFEDQFEILFSTPATLVVSFTITALLLLLTTRLDRSDQDRPLTWQIAVILGIAQGLAITPGISRSGTTIAVALMLGLPREQAARFSFLMSVPAIGGGLLLKLRDADLSAIDVPMMAVGGLAALVSGYFALVLLVRLVRSGHLSAFAWYLFGAAAFSLWLALTA